jgi:hypothetical protein
MLAFAHVAPGLSETQDPVPAREYQDNRLRYSLSGQAQLRNSRTRRLGSSLTMCTTPLQMTFTVHIQRQIQPPYRMIYLDQCQADS